jgi:ATP-dependent protease ClpP protease subunit
MIHEVSSMEWGKVEEIKSSTEETVRLNTLLLETLAKNTGKHKRYFLDIIHEKSHADWYLTPKEALSHDIATKIGTPSLITTVSVNYSLGEI